MKWNQGTTVEIRMKLFANASPRDNGDGSVARVAELAAEERNPVKQKAAGCAENP